MNGPNNVQPGLLLFALRSGIRYIIGMADTLRDLGRFRLAPDHCLVTILVAEGLLWLSSRLGWPPWHKGYAVLTAVAAVAAMMLLMLLWFVAALLFRWRFQFGIRSLLVLTVAVALPCSWLSWEMKKAGEQREAAEAVRKAGLEVGYDCPNDAEAYLTTSASNGPIWVHPAEACATEDCSVEPCNRRVPQQNSWVKLERYARARAARRAGTYGPYREKP